MRHIYVSMVAIIVSCIVFPKASYAGENSISGEFPFEGVAAIYSGPFTRLDRSDLLVLHKSGRIKFMSRTSATAMETYRLALYSFDGSEFHRIWMHKFIMLNHSWPGECPISSTTWCYGDFNKDGKCQLITCDARDIQAFTFYDTERPKRTLIKARDVWIDQLIACDIDDNGCDELVALELPNEQDTCCTYHLGIYKIVDDSLIEVWRGLNGVGENYGPIPPTSFISKCRIKGIPGEVPVLMESQSDMSLSNYFVIARTYAGDFERIDPFPRGEPWRKDVGPIGGVIFDDDDKILSYGYFLNHGNYKKLDAFSFGILEEGNWKLLEKLDPSVGGALCRFTIEPGRSGWLFVKNKKYSYYDSLPMSN